MWKLYRTLVENLPIERLGKRFLPVSQDDPIIPIVLRPEGSVPFTLYVNPNDRTHRSLLIPRTYEPEVARFLLKEVRPNDVFVDGGANAGYFSALVRANSRAQVFAFDPMPLNQECLKRNGFADNKYALSDKNGEAILKVRPNNSGSGSLVGYFGLKPISYLENMVVETRRLDSLVHRVDVIKLDIQGGELAALKGMGKLLDSVRSIIIEYTDGDEAIPWLLSNGFSVKDLKTKEPIAALKHKRNYLLER